MVQFSLTGKPQLIIVAILMAIAFAKPTTSYGLELTATNGNETSMKLRQLHSKIQAIKQISEAAVADMQGKINNITTCSGDLTFYSPSDPTKNSTNCIDVKTMVPAP